MRALIAGSVFPPASIILQEVCLGPRHWIVWLAGQVGAADASGKSLAGDFDGQVREAFSRLGQTLEQPGGALADMVTMTVFITDARYGDRFTQLRKEIFGDNFPASALITVAGLARPEMLVEVQGIAVLG
jgi:2-iminobutanoate/2-iminopropanoate deaminase